MLYKTMVAMIFCFAMAGAFSVDAKSDSKDKCLKTRAKIEKIQKKMRQGYTSKQGEKYRKKLTKLYKEEFKHCF
ncbi:hypothetical protein [Photobacterium sp. TY1-4]|uniref:hypothetical protein n=1 Tax=Photobacterium sp. TY1-4 TaxID=2899122 RepID=UPI0021BFAB02|nr:hypothetical protein [Photobacterium sp. TY1-4]UXI04093.1 hypothetical protein NH461_18450 [Photobacterium sp. TY1-4]